MTVSALLAIVAIVAFALGGLIAFVRVIRGTEHWVMSARDLPDGTIILIGATESELPRTISEPMYTVVLKGYRLGREVGPLAIDADNPPLPAAWTRTHLDTTTLPGSCAVRTGPVTLNFSRACLIANGTLIRPGERYEIAVPPIMPQAISITAEP